MSRKTQDCSGVKRYVTYSAKDRCVGWWGQLGLWKDGVEDEAGQSGWSQCGEAFSAMPWCHLHFVCSKEPNSVIEEGLEICPV